MPREREILRYICICRFMYLFLSIYLPIYPANPLLEKLWQPRAMDQFCFATARLGTVAGKHLQYQPVQQEPPNSDSAFWILKRCPEPECLAWCEAKGPAVQDLRMQKLYKTRQRPDAARYYMMEMLDDSSRSSQHLCLLENPDPSDSNSLLDGDAGRQQPFKSAFVSA